MTHTKGTWRKTFNSKAVISASKGSYNTLIAEVKNEADAKLIAAAPEMLEALKQVKQDIESGQGIMSETVTDVFQAIEKATK